MGKTYKDQHKYKLKEEYRKYGRVSKSSEHLESYTGKNTNKKKYGYKKAYRDRLYEGDY